MFVMLTMNRAMHLPLTVKLLTMWLTRQI